MGRGVRPPCYMHALTAQSGRVLRQGRERLHAAPGVAPPQARPCLCLRTTVQHTAACAGSVGRVQPRGGAPLTPQVWSPPSFRTLSITATALPPGEGGRQATAGPVRPWGPPSGSVRGGRRPHTYPPAASPPWAPCTSVSGVAYWPGPSCVRGFRTTPPSLRRGGLSSQGSSGCDAMGPCTSGAEPLLQPRLRPCQALCSGPPSPAGLQR